MPRLRGRAWERALAQRAPAGTSQRPARAPRRGRAPRVPAPDAPDAGAIPPVQILDVTPVPAPRQSRRDAWAPRPCVLRYRAMRDHLRMLRAQVPERVVMIFYLPMPPSWSTAKRIAHAGTPHRQKPDADNLLKATIDAVVADDAAHYDERSIKVWSWAPRIVIVDPRLCEVTDAFIAAHLPDSPRMSRSA